VGLLDWPFFWENRCRPFALLFHQLQKNQYRNRAGVLEKPCSGTFGSWLHAFLGKTGASPKVKSYVTLPFRKIRNCKGLEAVLPGFDIATFGGYFTPSHHSLAFWNI